MPSKEWSVGSAETVVKNMVDFFRNNLCFTYNSAVRFANNETHIVSLQNIFKFNFSGAARAWPTEHYLTALLIVLQIFNARNAHDGAKGMLTYLLLRTILVTKEYC